MKCYSVPEGVPAYEFSLTDWQKTDKDYIEAVAAKLREMGYTGEHTGKLYREPVADGNAVYMVMHGRTLALVHLPIGDAWQIPEAHMRGLRKADILRQINRKPLFGSL